MEWIGFAGAIFIGLSLGLLGGGGSLLALPILVYGVGMDAITATAYSLFTVGLTAAVGSVRAMYLGQVSYKAAVLFALPSFAGVFVTRSYILPNLPKVILTIGNFAIGKDMAIMVFFTLLMIGTSISMIKGRNQDQASSEELYYNLPVIVAAGLGVGIITGLVGAGGGFMIVPALVLLIRLPIKIAVSTTLLLVAANSLIGFLGDITAGFTFDYSFLFFFSGLAVVGIFIGGFLSDRISALHLRKGFGYFIIVAAAFILTQEFLNLYK